MAVFLLIIIIIFGHFFQFLISVFNKLTLRERFVR